MKWLLIAVFSLLLVSSASAHMADDLTEVKTLVESNTPCAELSDEQLEEIGEYYMERMHSGEAHEAMHGRMGLVEGTEEEESFHVNLAQTLYCGNGAGMMGNGMMGHAGMPGYGVGLSAYSGLLLLALVMLVIAQSVAILLLLKRRKK